MAIGVGMVVGLPPFKIISVTLTCVLLRATVHSFSLLYTIPPEEDSTVQLEYIPQPVY